MWRYCVCWNPTSRQENLGLNNIFWRGQSRNCLCRNPTWESWAGLAGKTQRATFQVSDRGSALLGVLLRKSNCADLCKSRCKKLICMYANLFAIQQDKGSTECLNLWNHPAGWALSNNAYISSQYDYNLLSDLFISKDQSKDSIYLLSKKHRCAVPRVVSSSLSKGHSTALSKNQANTRQTELH